MSNRGIKFSSLKEYNSITPSFGTLLAQRYVSYKSQMKNVGDPWPLEQNMKYSIYGHSCNFSYLSVYVKQMFCLAKISFA